MAIAGKIRVAIVRKARAADPATTTAKQIWDEVCAEFGVGVVSYQSVCRLIRDTGKELTGTRAAASARGAANVERLQRFNTGRALTSEQKQEILTHVATSRNASETARRLGYGVRTVWKLAKAARIELTAYREIARAKLKLIKANQSAERRRKAVLKGWESRKAVLKGWESRKAAKKAGIKL